MPSTEQIEEAKTRIKTSYFTTLKWCLRNQELLAKPSHDSIWEKLWEDDFAQSIEKELRTIASESGEVERENIKNLLRGKGCGFCDYDTDSIIDEALSKKEQ